MPDDDYALPGWMQTRARAILSRPWATSLWQFLRGVPLLKGLAKKLFPREDEDPLARDLQAIAALRLPRNDRFFAAQEAAGAIEGMLSSFSMAIIDSLLAFQDEAGIAGDMLEFGVHKGKSAALIGRHLRDVQRLVLVDKDDCLDERSIAPFRASADFLLTATENFQRAFPAYQAKRRGFRFIHIDASHAFQATFHELQMADHLLAPRGIIAMDDFTNLSYSQNIAAIFRYLFSTKTHLTMFLVTDDKCYLCRRGDFAFYAAFVLDRLMAEMESRGVPNLCLARTDMDPQYRAFYARTAGDKPGFFGGDAYQNYLLFPW